MITRITTLALLALTSTTARAQTPASLAAQSQQLAPGPRNVDPASIRFEIVVPSTAHSTPITGRIYVMWSKTAQPEPRTTIGRLGTPFFGHDVERLAPGTAAAITAADLGHPVWDMRDIPAGDYYAQAFVNVYSEFKRADGHTVWLHDDQWEGQNWSRSPGNLYSDVQKIQYDPAKPFRVRLEATHVIPPVVIPPDTRFV